MSDEASNALTSPPPLPIPTALTPRVSKFRWGIHLTLMAALPVFVGVAGAASHRDGPALTHSVRGLLTVCGMEVVFFAVVWGLALLASRPTRDDLLLRWRPGYWVVPLGLAYSVAIRVAAGIVLAVVLKIGGAVAIASHRASVAEVQKFVTENRPQVEKLVDIQAMTHNPAYFWLAVILVSFVIGGLREELWRSSFLAGLRSIWPRVFASQNGGIAGAAIAALFFGAGHLPQGMLAVAMITVVGFLLGVAMTVHRSIWPSVVAHGLFDAASMAALPYLPEFQKMLEHAGK
jgi:membrane protease YdiL (CAAX protease family)